MWRVWIDFSAKTVPRSISGYVNPSGAIFCSTSFKTSRSRISPQPKIQLLSFLLCVSLSCVSPYNCWDVVVLKGIIKQLIFSYTRLKLTVYRLRCRVVVVKLPLSNYSSNKNNPKVSKLKSPATRELEIEDKVTCSNKNGERNISF